MDNCENNCSAQKKLAKLEQDYNQLQSNLQLSAVYGKNLLEEIAAHKLQIKEMQTAREVYSDFISLYLLLHLHKINFFFSCQFKKTIT